MIKIELSGEVFNCRIEQHQYVRGGLAVELVTERGEPFCTLSVWFPESVLLPEDVFFLKDWSENAPVVEQLKELGILVEAEGPAIESGFVVSRPHKIRKEIV